MGRNGIVKIGSVQINNSFSGQNYLPTSIGAIQAYARKHLAHPEKYDFLLPIYNRIPVSGAVRKLLDADIVFFSTYVWNIRISLEIAREIKKLKPEVITVFGGPQVPNNAEAFIRKNTFVDLACHHEGEKIFLAILENLESRNWPDIRGVTFLGEDGVLVTQPRSERIKDLSSSPSPFLEGVFQPLMEANPHEKWIATWETNRGCPFSCSFCDWGSATQSRVFAFSLERLFKELEWFAQNKIEYVFCADANFGILPRDLQIVRYAAEIKKKYGYPQGFSVQNTKNATERAYECQKILAEAGLNKGVTIAFQSVDSETLRNIKRSNISSESFHELQRRFTGDGIETYTDLILALPGETFESFVNGASLLIKNGQHNRIQFANLALLPNAEMGDPEYQRKYGMVTVETRLINIHGSLADEGEEVGHEIQSLVIATSSMPKEDWVRARVFSWIASLFHFDKIFQIPFILLHEICAIPYRELIEIFSESSLEGFPVLFEIQTFFREKAKDIQSGGPEYCRSKEWLNIWWPPNEYMLIKLCVENKLNAFYEETQEVLGRFLKARFLDIPSRLLGESLQLNKGLLKIPFQTEDLILNLSYNIFEFYRSVLRGKPLPLMEKKSVYHIDRTGKKWTCWEDWFREVIWYGNKKGAYLYGNNVLEPQLEGHY